MKMIKNSNILSLWIKHKILKQKYSIKIVEYIRLFLEVAFECYKIKNVDVLNIIYESFLELRIRKSILHMIPKDLHNKLNELDKLMEK